MDTLGDVSAETSISTNTFNISLSLLKPILYPIQKAIMPIASRLRVARNIVTWEEPYIASLLTGGSIALGVVFLIFPWGFVFRWSSRALAWGLLGPHMKLVDIFYYSKLNADLTHEEELAQAETDLQAQILKRRIAARGARIQREDAACQRDMKAVLFGEYISKIATFSAERFVDIPSFSSTAQPYDDSQETKRRDLFSTRIYGQTLNLDSIIPDVRKAAITKPHELKKND